MSPTFVICCCFLCLLVLPYTCHADVIRIATVLTIPLQPWGKYATPCTTIAKAGCVGGFPIINAYLRASAQTYSQVALISIDDSSRFVQFHPKHLAINAFVWQRMSVIAWSFEGLGFLTYAASSVSTLFASMTISPIITNADITVPNPFYNFYQRQLVVTVGSLKLGILVVSDWNRVEYPMYDGNSLLPIILAQLRSFYNVNMTVVILSRPFVTIPWSLVNLDIDVLITGRTYNTSVKTPPPVSIMNGTLVIQRSSLVNSLTYLDIDVSLWQAYQQQPSTPVIFGKYQEIDVGQAVDFSTNPINDSTYYSDMQWMQTQVSLVTAADRQVGACDHAVPAGQNDTLNITPCRYTECAIGDWWAQSILAAYPDADLAFINGGSFRGGWNAGPVYLSDIWASYPFVDSTCSFYIYGIDLYDVFVYSFSKGQTSDASVSNTGPFGQFAGARFVHNPMLNGTRVISAEIFDSTLQQWLPISRGRKYKVVTTTYVCGGGDGYGAIVNFYPGTNPEETSYEVHELALDTITNYGFTCPSTQGTMTLSNSTSPLIMTHLTQRDCGSDTIWVASELDCVACPANTATNGTGATVCTPVVATQAAASESVNILVPVVVSIGGGLLLLILGTAFYLYRQRRLREQFLLALAPSGQVTMVFTDIQGSTALWDKLPDDMFEALEIHNRILREEMHRLYGYEVKTIGDSFMIAFPSALSAVEFSVNIQTLLLEQQWPEDLLKDDTCCPVPSTKDPKQLIWNGLRVRVGMQIGNPEHIVDHSTCKVDYFGPMVNQAARVESKAHGGEICITKDVLDHIQSSSLSASLAVNYLGEFLFKGVSNKLQVYSVQKAELSERTYPPDKPNVCDKCHEPLNCPKCDALADATAASKKGNKYLVTDPQSEKRHSRIFSRVSRPGSPPLVSSRRSFRKGDSFRRVDPACASDGPSAAERNANP